jgi:uncharacterized protein (TIGR02646 family)
MVRTPRRAPEPAELTANRALWTARYLRIHQGHASGDWATDKAKRILKPHLYALAHGKCVYCESALDVTAALEIDHYHPKSVCPNEILTWTNLLPACSKCNGAKGEEDHGGSLLKPDDEDPEPYFWVHPDTGKLEPHPSLDAAGVRRAEETIRICDLQRAALRSQRADLFQRVAVWLERRSRNDPSKDLLDREWDRFADPRAEYKLVIRHVLRLALHVP